MAAFVRGEWKIQVTMAGGDQISGTARVDESTWRLRVEQRDETPMGGWALIDGKLHIHVGEFFGGGQAVVHGVPAKVPSETARVFSWQPPTGPSGSSGESLKVTRSNGTVRIVHTEGGSRTTIVCTRA
ncbi:MULTISPECIES: hypothetical protein [unclassified Spirillospora]|uniref:hypothetical protein n=1 Tax=unclassified Spirillospora TaxID=2642701 RepID=UPI003723C654